jgi:hypothetical protein
MKGLRKRFPELLIVDGSRLDTICHRLKLLRKESSPIVPGALSVFYDLFRGITRQVLFSPNADEAELPRTQPALDWIHKGTLLLGDRLYASIQHFHDLTKREIFGLFRLNEQRKIKVLKILTHRQGSRTLLENILVEVGTGVGGVAKIRLRLIRYRSQGLRLDLLTNIMDIHQLTAEEAVSLYGLRWSIERMFFDLKEVLNLRCLYASHPNLVAQQIYAAAIVHTAFRIAQASIAAKAKVLPEQLSPAKLFPKLAQAASDYCALQWSAIETRALNPGIKIKIPDFHRYSTMYTWLRTLLVQRRNSHRRRRKFNPPSREPYKSFARVAGGPSLLKSLSVH